jgi:hypothetical protein
MPVRTAQQLGVLRQCVYVSLATMLHATKGGPVKLRAGPCPTPERAAECEPRMGRSGPSLGTISHLGARFLTTGVRSCRLKSCPNPGIRPDSPGSRRRTGDRSVIHRTASHPGSVRGRQAPPQQEVPRLPAILSNLDPTGSVVPVPVLVAAPAFTPDHRSAESSPRTIC